MYYEHFCVSQYLYIVRNVFFIIFIVIYIITVPNVSPDSLNSLPHRCLEVIALSDKIKHAFLISNKMMILFFFCMFLAFSFIN